jgi:hypothetical protein
MDFLELENALDLQKRAYALLLWTGKEAAHLIDNEMAASPCRCADWLKRHLNEFPAELRPAPAEFDVFAKMLASFFNSSFHLEGSGASARLVRGQKFKDRRNKKYAHGRAIEAAAELSRLAVISLAQDAGITPQDEAVSAILNDPALGEMVHLWAYACELVRRSRFASQGSAVHHLWLELDDKKRRRLDADEIWKERSVLIEALRRKTAVYE